MSLAPAWGGRELAFPSPVEMVAQWAWFSSGEGGVVAVVLTSLKMETERGSPGRAGNCSGCREEARKTGERTLQPGRRLLRECVGKKLPRECVGRKRTAAAGALEEVAATRRPPGGVCCGLSLLVVACCGWMEGVVKELAGGCRDLEGKSLEVEIWEACREGRLFRRGMTRARWLGERRWLGSRICGYEGLGRGGGAETDEGGRSRRKEVCLTGCGRGAGVSLLIGRSMVRKRWEGGGCGYGKEERR